MNLVQKVLAVGAATVFAVSCPAPPYQSPSAKFTPSPSNFQISDITLSTLFPPKVDLETELQIQCEYTVRLEQDSRKLHTFMREQGMYLETIYESDIARIPEEQREQRKAQFELVRDRALALDGKIATVREAALDLIEYYESVHAEQLNLPHCIRVMKNANATYFILLLGQMENLQQMLRPNLDLYGIDNAPEFQMNIDSPPGVFIRKP